MSCVAERCGENDDVVDVGDGEHACRGADETKWVSGYSVSWVPGVGLGCVGFGVEAVEHHGDGGDFDPSFGCRSGVFEVAFAEASVCAEPRKGPFDDPPVAHGDERVTRRVLDDLDDEAKARSALVEPLVAGIAAHDPEHRVLQPRATQELVASSDVRHIRRRHQHRDQQPQRVHQNMAFATADLLSGVVSDLVGGSSVGNALRVEDCGARPRVVSSVGAGLVVQQAVNAVPGAVAAPPREPIMHR